MIPAPDRTTPQGSHWWTIQREGDSEVEVYWHGTCHIWTVIARGPLCSAQINLGREAPAALLLLAHNRRGR